MVSCDPCSEPHLSEIWLCCSCCCHSIGAVFLLSNELCISLYCEELTIESVCLYYSSAPLSNVKIFYDASLTCVYKTKFQIVKDEMHKRKLQGIPFLERRDESPGFQKPPEQDQFYASLVTAKAIIMCQIQESGRNLLSSPKVLEQNNAKTILSLTSVHEEPIPSVDGKP